MICKREPFANLSVGSYGEALDDIVDALERIHADITAECEIVQSSEELSARFPDHRLCDLQLYEHIND